MGDALIPPGTAVHVYCRHVEGRPAFVYRYLGTGPGGRGEWWDIDARRCFNADCDREAEELCGRAVRNRSGRARSSWLPNTRAFAVRGR